MRASFSCFRRSASAAAAVICASFCCFRRSASAAAAAMRASLSRFTRMASAAAAVPCASFSRVRRSDSACALIRAASASRVTRSVSDCAAARSLSARASRSDRLLALSRQGLFLLTFDGDGPRVFRRLHGFPGGHGHRLLAGVARLVGLGLGPGSSRPS